MKPVIVSCDRCAYWDMYPDGLNGYCCRHAPHTAWGESNYVQGLHSEVFPATGRWNRCGEGSELSEEDIMERINDREQYRKSHPSAVTAALSEAQRRGRVRKEEIYRKKNDRAKLAELSLDLLIEEKLWGKEFKAKCENPKY